MRSSRRLLAGAMAAASLALFACGAARVSLAPGPREYVPTDYEHIRERWTRTSHLVALAELDDLLTVTATFESWDFRWAYVVRYAQDFRMTTEQRRVLLESTLDETKKHHQFYVALYGQNRKWTALSKPTSAWIVRLIDDRGGETAPEEIVPISKPGAIERTYFPYTTPFRHAFRIRFPVATEHGPTIAPGAKWIGLRFAGVQGSEDLVWDVEPGSASELAAGASDGAAR